MNKIALATVTYNSSKVIREFLDCLNQQKFKDWHLYLVDSCSSDETIAIVNDYVNIDSKITLFKQKDNVGFAAGSNIGIKQAILDGFEYIMLVNNDVEFNSDFLSLIMNEIKSNQYQILAPKMNYFSPKNKIWAAGGGFKPRNAWAAYHIGENEIDVGQYDVDGYCDFIPMCCVVIKKDVLDKVGWLDENYFIYSEDADWFYRANNLGYKIRYFHKAILYHKVSSLTGGTSSRSGASYGTRNRVYFISKHFSGVQKYTYLVKYFVGMFVFLVNGKYSWQEFKWRFPAFFNGLKIAKNK